MLFHHSESFRKIPVNIKNHSSHGPSSLALPWIEITATGLAKTKEPIEFHYFRSEARVYILTE